MAVALLAIALSIAQEGPSAAELWREAEAVRAEDPERALFLEQLILERHPDSPEARAVQRRWQAQHRPSLIGALGRFLFGTIIGWWILFVGAFVLSLPLVSRYRTWRARQRFMKAQGQKFANPQNADARFQLGEIYLQAGRCRRAEAYAQEAVSIASGSRVYDGVPYAYLRALGQAQYGCRRYREAADTFQRALKAKSDLGYFDALLGLAKSHYRIGHADRALEFARHAVAEQESHLEGYFRWAQAAARLGRGEETRAAKDRFWKVALRLPRYARQRRSWWRLAFLTFPVSRLVG